MLYDRDITAAVQFKALAGQMKQLLDVLWRPARSAENSAVLVEDTITDIA